MDLIRDIRICKDCKHKLEDGFCAILDSPIEVLTDDIMWEEDKKFLQMAAMVAGGNIEDLKWERSKIDRKLDSSCPYILEQIVLRQE